MAGYHARSPRGFRMRHLSGTGILLTDAEDPTSGLVWSQVVAVAQGVPANVVAIGRSPVTRHQAAGLP
jgi:hypothetical protein